MKQRLFIFSVLATFLILQISCSDDNWHDTQSVSTNVDSGLIRAITIAQHSVPLLEQKDGRLHTLRLVDAAGGIYYVTNREVLNRKRVRGSVVPNDTLLYIINFMDDNGYAIISAVNGKEELLIITEKGHFNPDKGSENEGEEMFVDLAADYVINGGGITSSDTLQSFGCTPMVPVQWGQESGYNKFAPNNYAGCSNTAVAMVFCTFGHPSSLTLTYPMDLDSLRPNTLSLDWDILRTYKNYYDDYFQGQPARKDSIETVISRLMRQTGYQMNSSYGSNSTWTDPSNVRLFLQLNGYSVGNYQTYTATTNLGQEMDLGYLIIMRGKRMINSSGHMWIIDGYLPAQQIATLLQNTISNYLPNQNANTTLYHLNWGFDGYANGYYRADLFRMSQAYSYDDPDPYIIYVDSCYQYSLQYMKVKKRNGLFPPL